MPRQRKAQSWATRIWTGRVANTTTSSNTQVVYRVAAARKPMCEPLAVEVVGTSPINVAIEWTNVYRISLDTDALKNIIENYPDLDLSNVEVSLGTVDGDVTFTGNVNVEWEFTGTTINAENGNITSITSTDITTNTLDAETVNTGDLNASGNVEVGGTLDVTWATTLKDTLTVNWDSVLEWNVTVDWVASFNNNVDVNGDVRITWETNTETLSVNDFATIPTLTSTDITTETLKVNNMAEVDWPLTVGQGLSVEWTTTLEDLIVQDDATFEKDVEVQGTTTMQDLNAQNTTLETLTVNGTSLLTGDTTMSGNATVAKDLTVAGNSTVVGNSTVSGNSLVTWDSIVNGDSTVNGDTSLNGKVTTADDVTVWWNLKVNDDVVVDWTTTLKGAVEMKDDVEINGSVNIDGSVAIDDGLEVTGHTKTTTLRANEAVFDEVRINRSLDLGDDWIAPDFVLQKEKWQPNGVAPLDVNGKIPEEYLPPVYTTAIVKMGTGIFDNSDTAIVQDDAITAYSYVNISNYSDIHGDLDEIINEWQLTIVSNQTETGSFKYIIVNPIS